MRCVRCSNQSSSCNPAADLLLRGEPQPSPRSSLSTRLTREGAKELAVWMYRGTARRGRVYCRRPQSQGMLSSFGELEAYQDLVRPTALHAFHLLLDWPSGRLYELACLDYAPLALQGLHACRASS
jgi:hypothetical protein